MVNSTPVTINVGPAGNPAQAPMVVSDYLRDFSELLHAQRFRAIPDHGGAFTLWDERGQERSARNGAWFKR